LHIQLDACFLVVLDSIANDAYVGAFRAHHTSVAVVVHMVVALMTKLLEPVPMSIPERVLA
jgi:hypothetical protein